MKRIIFVFLSVALLILTCMCFVACGNKGEAETADKTVTVTLLDGEHYSVSGDNKRVAGDGSVTFEVTLDRGHKIIGAYGDECEISNDLSFEQTVTFTDVKYKSTVRLETAEMATSDFRIYYDDQAGDVAASSVLGQAYDGVYYAEDILDLTATPNENYRFWCWSTGEYINDGGEFFGYSETLDDFDFNSVDDLYANFKPLGDVGNTVIYRFSDGNEIEQDVTELLAHHPRANTYTAVDMRNMGVDCDSKYLAGWQTDGGEYIGLGSRVSVSDETATILTPVWKKYTDESLFEINADGKLSLKSGTPELDEIVMPREIDGTEVTAICENAFAGCGASVYYIPDSVTTVEDDAFKDCESLTDLYMSDNVMTISDKSFAGCKNFTTLHLNAYLKPRYSDISLAGKAEVYDRLAKNINNGIRKLVMLGGSSVMFGYSTKVIERLFAEQTGAPIEIYNLGIDASAAGIVQYEIARPYLSENDIFLHAPENYLGAWSYEERLSPLTNSYCAKENRHLWYIAESNLQFVSNLEINNFANIFDELKIFNNARITKPPLEYSDYFVTVADNEYGRRNTQEVVLPEQRVDNSFGYNGNRAFTDIDSGPKHAVEEMYPYFEARGIHVYVTYAPINRHNLYNTYNTEEELKTAADAYSARVESILSDTCATVILSQYDTVYDGRHFSNTDYHLGDPFRNTHTETVISALISAMKSEGKL